MTPQMLNNLMLLLVHKERTTCSDLSEIDISNDIVADSETHSRIFDKFLWFEQYCTSQVCFSQIKSHFITVKSVLYK